MVLPVLSDNIPKRGEEATEIIIGNVLTKPDRLTSIPRVCKIEGTRLRTASRHMLNAMKPQKKSRMSFVRSSRYEGFDPACEPATSPGVATASSSAADEAFLKGSLTQMHMMTVAITTNAQ